MMSALTSYLDLKNRPRGLTEGNWEKLCNSIMSYAEFYLIRNQFRTKPIGILFEVHDDWHQLKTVNNPGNYEPLFREAGNLYVFVACTKTDPDKDKPVHAGEAIEYSPCYYFEIGTYAGMTGHSKIKEIFKEVSA